MPLEEFIITVFCWVETAFEDVTAGIKLRARGFAPRLSDSEVITLEIVGEVLGYDGDEAIWSYFKRHWAAWFPGLGDRSTFVRQAANLWRVKQWLHERLVGDLGAPPPPALSLTASPSPCASWPARRAATSSKRKRTTATVPRSASIITV